ncbi:hypothetical protein ACWDV4_15165 [Micromonospora sp. NPDC003197]
MTSMSNENDENSQPSTLERRYRRLLWAYPADYRTHRGPEIVGTYLDLAGSDRRRPSLSDVADLLRGGLRQRLRAADSLGLIDGVRLAAALALPVAVALATAWLMTVETAWLSGISFVAFAPSSLSARWSGSAGWPLRHWPPCCPDVGSAPESRSRSC